MNFSRLWKALYQLQYYLRFVCVVLPQKSLWVPTENSSLRIAQDISATNIKPHFSKNCILKRNPRRFQVYLTLFFHSYLQVNTNDDHMLEGWRSKASPAHWSPSETFYTRPGFPFSTKPCDTKPTMQSDASIRCKALDEITSSSEVINDENDVPSLFIIGW